MVRFCLVGDVMTGGVLSTEFDRFRSHCLPAATQTWFDADVVFANLECGVSNRGKPMEDKILTYAHPRTLRILAEMNVNVVSLANNHILDYGIEEAEDTMAALD